MNQPKERGGGKCAPEEESADDKPDLFIQQGFFTWW